MSRFLLAFISVALFAHSQAYAAAANPVDELQDATSSKFAPGQVWTFKGPPGNEKATLTILKIERHPSLGIIVHISISDAVVRTRRFPNGTPLNANHLPFFEPAIVDSAIALIRSGRVPTEGLAGYAMWRKEMSTSERLSAFSISVGESINVFEKTLDQ